MTMFVKKSKVIHEAEGYLVYYHSDKYLFIPSKDTSIDTFLKDTSLRKGYFLGSVCGLGGLEFISQKLNVNMVYTDHKQEVLLPDSIYLGNIRFRYLLNKIRQTDFNDTLEFEYYGRRHKIDASSDFFGEELKADGHAR